jgi:hypothetical protein
MQQDLPKFFRTSLIMVQELGAVEGDQNCYPFDSEMEVRRTPRANESRKILSVNPSIVGLSMPYRSATWGRPGAIIELAKGDTNVYSET